MNSFICKQRCMMYVSRGVKKAKKQQQIYNWNC